MIEPFTFRPVYQTRVWGGNSFRNSLNRDVPSSISPCGESWEIVDRPEAQSIVNTGSLKGLTLNELWCAHREIIFGTNMPESDRFPLLLKILDCQQDLSIQVHPPKKIAKRLEGEAKSELWYIMEAKPQAQVYVGFKKRLTQKQFRTAIEQGQVADTLNAIEPKTGEAIYLKSGRLHAIGAGLLIYEIQQNSDTTYRVFDWNRKDSNGKSRELHIKESLQSINFNDVKPKMDPIINGSVGNCEFFKVTRETKTANEIICIDRDQFSILSILKGELKLANQTTFYRGDTIIVPCGNHSLTVLKDTQFLITTLKNN